MNDEPDRGCLGGKVKVKRQNSPTSSDHIQKKYYRNILSYEAKTTQSLSDFKHKLAFHAFYWIALIPCIII